jgi:hypothetical protein
VRASSNSNTTTSGGSSTASSSTTTTTTSSHRLRQSGGKENGKGNRAFPARQETQWSASTGLQETFEPLLTGMLTFRLDSWDDQYNHRRVCNQ